MVFPQQCSIVILNTHIYIYSKIPISKPPLGRSKVVLKTTFGESQRWSIIRGTLGVENEEKNNLNFANKVFKRCLNFRTGGLNSKKFHCSFSFRSSATEIQRWTWTKAKAVMDPKFWNKMFTVTVKVTYMYMTVSLTESPCQDHS